MPPLCVTGDQIEHGAAALAQAMEELTQRVLPGSPRPGRSRATRSRDRHSVARWRPPSGEGGYAEAIQQGQVRDPTGLSARKSAGDH
ncbi:MAG: hypothetical protein KDN19_12040 [Verrucomicrobiae bacterium]|nr:hypothetical protein [Verrucomicrobiae bacterium]